MRIFLLKKERNVRAPKSIDVIRLRPGQFIGDNTTPAHLIHECIDNFLDELRNNFGDTAGISFSRGGEIFVFDNGRGLPIGEATDEETKKIVDSIELLFTKLHSGTKFSLEDDQLETLFGQNGVGLVAVNALSDFVDVKTQHADEIWHYRFEDGLLVKKEKLTSPLKFSTEIIFKPSKKYFQNDKITSEQLHAFYDRLCLAQAKITNGKFYFNKKQIDSLSLESFVRNKLHLTEGTPLFQFEKSFSINCREVGNKNIIKKKVKIYVALTYEAGETILFGDVNLRFCEGTFLNNVQTVIKNNLPSKLDKKYQKLPDRFLIEGLRLYISLDYPTPQFDSQTKTRFVSDVKNDVIQPITNDINKILSEEHIKTTVEKILSQKLNNSITKITKQKISSDNKLRDCTNKPGDTLYIIEGDSAESVFRDCRDTHREADLPLRGKIINVEKQSLAKITANKEIKNLIEAVGSYPYRYKNVKIVADGDFDGLHINILVILLFLKYFPELIKEGRLSIVLPPLYGAKKGKEFIPIYNIDEIDLYRNQKFEIQRFKGLGEMTASQMRKTLNTNHEYTVIYPKSEKIVEKLLKIITDTNEKQKILNMMEFNFQDFLKSIFQ